MLSDEVFRTPLEREATGLLEDIKALQTLPVTRKLIDGLAGRYAPRSRARGRARPRPAVSEGATVTAGMAKKVREHELDHYRHLRGRLVQFVERALEEIYPDTFEAEVRQYIGKSLVIHMWPKIATVPDAGRLEGMVNCWGLATRLSVRAAGTMEMADDAPEELGGDSGEDAVEQSKQR